MSRLAPTTCVLLLAVLLVFGCSDSNDVNRPDDTETTYLSIASLTESMKRTTPDLSDGAYAKWGSDWADWSGDDRPILPELFDATIYGGTWSIFFGAVMFDELARNLVGEVPVSALSGGEGELEMSYLDPMDNDPTARTNWTVAWQPAPATVELPEITGLDPAAGFLTQITATISSATMQVYYGRGNDGDRIYLTWQANDPTDTKLGTGFVWADRTWSEGMEIWFGSASPGGLTVTYAELDDTSFRFKKKNNEHDGWLVFGGGTVTLIDNEVDPANSQVALRLTTAADSAEGANDGGGIPADHAGHTYYVKLTWEDMMDPEYDGGGYPRADDQLPDETDPVTNVIKIGESACLFADLAALWAFRYPASVAELLPE